MPWQLNASQGNGGRAYNEQFLKLFDKFFNIIKERKRIPKLNLKQDQYQQVIARFVTNLNYMLMFSSHNYVVKQEKYAEPTLKQALDNTLKYLAYNK